MNAQLNQQPGTEFKREQRYYVLKLSDIHGSVSLADLLYLDKIARTVADRRAQEGKEQREYLVIESDWPEYEPTWQAIEARVSGVQHQAPQLVAAGWRPKLKAPTSLPPSSFNAGMPDKATVDYWKAQGVEIEYCYTGTAPIAPEEWVLMPRDLNEYEAISAQGTLLDMAWCETTCFVERYKALIRYTEPRRAALAAQAKGGA